MEEIKTPPHSIVVLTGKDAIAVFDFYRDGKIYYSIDIESLRYTFPIDITNTGEIGQSTLGHTEKASLFRRYINLAIKDNKMVWNTIIDTPLYKTTSITIPTTTSDDRERTNDGVQ